MEIDSTTLAELLNSSTNAYIPPNSSSNSNGNRSCKPSYVDTIRNNASQITTKNVPVQNLPSPTKQTLPDQTSLNQIIDNLSKLEQKFKTLSDDLIVTKNISKELQQGQLNLFMRVENIEQLCHIFPLE
ncbi:9208_t:CDS:2 [Funneliformis geosporum]|nr:9208_t:CDS:2 [Funneliformis geosporum]